MYSKNDYRYYLENQLMHSDDYFAHYGVKGMKWKHHKKIGQELKDIKYDIGARQIGEVARGNTVYDPVKDTYRTGRRSQKLHTNESTATTTYRNHLTGEYKIKRRTTKSNLFKAIDGKNTKANEAKENRAVVDQVHKKLKYKRTKNGLENRETGEGYVTTKSKPDSNGWSSIDNKKYDTKRDGTRKSVDSYTRKKKSKRKPLTKDSFKREKPKGKKLKGSNNIYVSHETTLK